MVGSQGKGNGPRHSKKAAKAAAARSAEADATEDAATLANAGSAMADAQDAQETQASPEPLATPQYSPDSQQTPYSSPSSPASDPSPLHSTADDIVGKLNAIDEKVNTMRSKQISDPDSLGDKIFKVALPSAIGIVGGKLFKTVWDKSVVDRHGSAKLNDGETQQQSLLASMTFAALSAAFTAIITELGGRGSQAFVTRRQHRRGGK
ncbi:DUF4235 domain-containing protein [Bifidobacterium sp. ESL0790]|uniref:DUF4235 domain-containing protein n=1 Tax=Bifidobacterium sp. ESL0790 TaxID=2983233 RepID=UPI0023F9AC0D|nr:DUF4235 domain-containing protein [Bifidobacterium sp. ESL0790]WEV72498.1 DUF4235 domain-containing protein [Bifidobacterium sp. ESL0790]